MAMKKSGRERRDIVRLEILRSAATAFRRSGYHGTNMNQIADAVSMTKSNLYNYFKTKEDILFFCHQYGMARLLKTFDRIDGKPYSPEVKLRRLIAEFVHLMVDELDGEILALEVKELTGGRLRRVIAMRDKLDRCMRRTIANGVKSGSFRQVDPKLAAFTIWGAMNWIPRWFDPAGSAGSVEISDAMVDCFFDGMRNHSGSRRK